MRPRVWYPPYQKPAVPFFSPSSIAAFAARGAVFNRGHTAKQTVTDIYVSSATNDKYIVTTKAESGDERAAEIQITRSEGGIKIKHYVPFYVSLLSIQSNDDIGCN